MTFAITESVTGTFDSITDTNADGTQWDLIYDVKAFQAEYVEFFYKYTKNASTEFTIQVSFSNKELTSTDFYKETILDPSLLTISSAVFTEADAGNFRIIYPVGKADDKVKITIIPDVASGTDTMVVHMVDLAVKSSR